MSRIGSYNIVDNKLDKNYMGIHIEGFFIKPKPKSTLTISLTPNQAHSIVDICERLNLTAPLCDGEYHSWLRSACDAFIAYLNVCTVRLASQAATSVIIDCLTAARDGMNGYNRMQELERAEEYCQLRLDKHE